MSNYSAKLGQLADSEGYDDPLVMLEDATHEGVVPGICVNPDCDYTQGIEPDSRDGWCPECETNTLWSCIELGFETIL